MDAPPSGRRSDLQARGYEPASTQTMESRDTITSAFVSALDTSRRSPNLGHRAARRVDDHDGRPLVPADCVSNVVRDRPETVRRDSSSQVANLMTTRAEVDLCSAIARASCWLTFVSSLPAKWTRARPRTISAAMKATLDQVTLCREETTLASARRW